MENFPSLSAAARKRLAEFGIDPDCSYGLLQAEVSVQPPPRLVRDIGNASYVEAIDSVSTQRGQPLTDREREVVQALRDGLTNAQTGIRLGLSPHTVNSHHKRIFKKLGVRTRAAAIRLAPAYFPTTRTEAGVYAATVAVSFLVFLGVWEAVAYLLRRR